MQYTVSTTFAGKGEKSGKPIHFTPFKQTVSQNHDQERKQKYLANLY